jgi:hypothetical protein
MLRSRLLGEREVEVQKLATGTAVVVRFCSSWSHHMVGTLLPLVCCWFMKLARTC